MQTLLIVYLFFFCVALSGVASQPHLAGGAQSPIHLIGSTPHQPPQRYVTITQTAEHEWERLASTFTLELWIFADPASVNLDLNWTKEYAADEMQFWGILSRHPGLNYGNEWAHFNLQLTRTTKGAAVVFWSGCGCETPMSERDHNSCGFAYVLASDWAQIPPTNRFYLRPGSWHHIAVSVDGDSITQGFTSGIARLFIDGVELLNNRYADPSNNPPYRTGPVCKGRPIYSQTVAGTKNDMIRLGFYNNQDTIPGSTNSDSAFGFFGYLDEVRVWDVARSPVEIISTWHSILDPVYYPNLIGLYNFNEPGPNNTFPNVASSDKLPVAQVEPSNSTDPQAPHNGLVISQIVYVKGSDRKGTPTTNSFQLLGSSATGYNLTEASDFWLQALQKGDAIFMDGSGAVIRSFPSTVNLKPLSVIFYCADADCTNIPADPLAASIKYTSLEDAEVYSLVYFMFEAVCYEPIDHCGVCGGDNRTCQCVIYHEFRNTRMAYILLTWSLEKIIVELDLTISILQSIESILTTDFDFETIEGNYTLAAEVSYMMDFYNLCLTDYCADVTEFTHYLDAYLSSLLPPPPSPKVEILRDSDFGEILTKSSRYVKVGI